MNSSQYYLSYVIPIVTYGFLGVEVVAITAYEARDLRSLRLPSQTIAYFIVFLYLFCGIGEFLNVKWTDGDLPPLYGGINKDSAASNGPIARTRAIIVIAAFKAGYKKMAGFLNGCMIFSALSASNTALYVASRALYGMTWEIRNRGNRENRAQEIQTLEIHPRPWLSWLGAMGTVWHKSGVPMLALVISAISFFWLPFLQLRKGYAIADVFIQYSRSRCLLISS